MRMLFAANAWLALHACEQIAKPISVKQVITILKRASASSRIANADLDLLRLPPMSILRSGSVPIDRADGFPIP